MISFMRFNGDKDTVPFHTPPITEGEKKSPQQPFCAVGISLIIWDYVD
jgi:hypothetical protein